MKLSKREKTLLWVLAAVVALAAVWLLAIQPVIRSLEEKQQQLDSLNLQRAEMEQVIAGAEGARQDYDAQGALAAQNYEEFYATLNSYTIDDILSGLLADNHLEVRRLTIGEYQKITDAQLLTGEASATDAADGYLLRCAVQIEAAGSYENIMHFLTAMNEKSDCLRVSQLQLSYASERNAYGAEAMLECSVDIYGIERPDVGSM